MMPEAPVRFSTMKACFSESCSLAARRRARGSTEPPGGYGDTNLTTLVGHSCASAFPVRRKRTANKSLKADIPSFFEFQHLPRIVGGRDGEADAETQRRKECRLLGFYS